MTSLALTLATAALLTATGAAHAALVDRGGGMIYDTTRDITWLADMNFAATSGHDDDGLMSWANAQQWADGLVYGGFDDWRLPTLNPSSDTSCSNTVNPGGGFPLQYYGYNCSGGELSGLFVTELGNQAGESVLDQTGDTAEQVANLALFSNVQAVADAYWSGTAFEADPDLVWSFHSSSGLQNFGDNDYAFHALAVRAGDVPLPLVTPGNGGNGGGSSVPEPQSLALAVLGLLGAAGTRWTRSR